MIIFSIAGCASAAPMVRRLVAAIALLAALPGAASAQAKKMTLPELIDLARSTNPGLHASAAVTDASRAQVTEAWTNWLPSGSLLSLVAPSPQVHCLAPPGLRPPPGVSDTEFARQNCIQTNATEFTLSNVSFRQVFTRTELGLVQPLWDFGKISAGLAAARAGVDVSREREAGARADVEL